MNDPYSHYSKEEKLPDLVLEKKKNLFMKPNKIKTMLTSK